MTFYALLVGTKLALAAVVAGGRRRLLDSAGYAWALRGAAVLLVGAGALLALEGLQRLA